MALAATAIAYLRVGPTAMRVLWAEDASPFLQDAHRFGGLVVALRPYGGYVHLIPRLIATVVVLLPIDPFATAISLSACAVAGAVAAVTFELAKSVTSSLAVRVTLSAAVVLLPAAPIEVLGNIANLHSYGLWLVPFLLLAQPASRRQSFGLGALGLAIALSEIQVALFAPFFVLGMRDRLQWPKLAGLILGLLVQAAALVAAPRHPVITGSAGFVAMAKGFMVNGLLSLINPQGEAIRGLVLAVGWPVVVAGLLLLAALLIAAARIAAPKARLGILLLAFGSVATFALGYAMTPFPDYDRYLDQPVFHVILLRYAVISSLFLLGAAILAAGEFLPSRRPWQSAVLGSAVLVAVWASFAVNLHQRWTWRSGGPAWHKSLAAAIADCRGRDPDRYYAVAPVWPRGVAVEFTCRKFATHAR